MSLFARTVLAAATAVLFLSTKAFAQTEQRGTSSVRASATGARVSGVDAERYRIEFDDNPLAALPKDGTVPSIRVRPVHSSGYLLRPRTHFVSEMLKSVERL